MEFSTLRKEAEKSCTNTFLKVTSEDVSSRRLYLSSIDQSHSFFLSCPTFEDSTWSVWSTQENSLHLLQSEMDSLKLDSCKNVGEVIESLDKLLRQHPSKVSEINKTNIDDQTSDGDDDEEEDDDYYLQDDYDAQEDDAVKVSESKESEMEEASNFFKSRGESSAAVMRLVKDLKVIQKSSQEFGISGCPRANNIFMWPVIKLDVQFPSDYPFSPPFIRVLKPRFKFLTGHITVGGSICMEVLTKSGWCPANDIESVLIQVRTEILSDPKACLDPKRPNIEYTQDEAREAFVRMVKKYGWS